MSSVFDKFAYAGTWGIFEDLGNDWNCNYQITHQCGNKRPKWNNNVELTQNCFIGIE